MNDDVTIMMYKHNGEAGVFFDIKASRYHLKAEPLTNETEKTFDFVKDTLDSLYIQRLTITNARFYPSWKCVPSDTSRHLWRILVDSGFA